METEIYTVSINASAENCPYPEGFNFYSGAENRIDFIMSPMKTRNEDFATSSNKCSNNQVVRLGLIGQKTASPTVFQSVEMPKSEDIPC